MNAVARSGAASRASRSRKAKGIGRRAAAASLLGGALAMGAGCAATPPPEPWSGAPPKPAARAAAQTAAPELPPAAPAAAPERFPATTAALHDEIERRASELRRGPIGSRATELASLRLAASARDLLESGSPDGALASLERAVSLSPGNGYAYFWLACLHQLQGRPERAAELVAKAERYLPSEPRIAAELEGLREAIRRGKAG